MDQSAATVGANTYQRIKRDIIFGALQPGAKLKLDALKARYPASLSTLREALNRLASDGFVDAPEQRGFFVTPVSQADLTEIANLRVLLECHALRASIANGDTEWEGKLVAARHKLAQMEQRLLRGDHSEEETWKRYDWEFHLALIEACNSRNLLSLHSRIYDKYLRYQMLVLTHRGQEAATEHDKILQAALARDAGTATALLEVHIRNGLVHAASALTPAR
ncbi:GntR family transcriptional regulator [Jannaschia sp. EhC01]|nr:GntR family transcriptional regulator [Jannaschia sp. EhC01]